MTADYIFLVILASYFSGYLVRMIQDYDEVKFAKQSQEQGEPSK